MTKIAFLFPGQGSQSLGMMAQLAGQSQLVATTFEEASAAAGVDLWRIAQDGPKEQLDRTEITQPAMLAADVATWRIWQEMGGFLPDYMAGHSLGEYAALVAAGTLDFPEAVRLVVQRARLMQQATPEGVGAMAAILGLDDADLQRVCESVANGQVVSCANYNSPGQIVIAGHREAVERACEAAKEAGAKRAVPLAVSVPSHCELMRTAALELESSLGEIRIMAGGIPVIHNADLGIHTEDQALKAALAEQLWKPVRWSETIQELTSLGVGRYAECGPGGVLSGLNRRNARGAETVSLSDVESMQAIIAEWS